MADFQLKVTAETQKATQDLKRLDKTATDTAKTRTLNFEAPSLGNVVKGFRDLDKNISTAANDIKQFYGIAKKLPGVGDQIKTYENAVKGTIKTTNTLASNTKAGDILTNSFQKASTTVGTLVNNLAKVGFALYGIKEIVGVLRQAFGGFFNETIGREIKLRETMLKTQTTLASTNKVFRNGTEITDPYQKIVSLTGEVAKRIDSIRERSIALAGVTSNDVIEVFGIVASQVGQIGGGLKEAEDLAINFSAALGTFGIPLYQARQEIGSILRGQITEDSYLAKALGIGSKDIQEAKTKAGGVVKFLEERLSAAVAGQKIAAQGFSGVVSNIKDLYELVSQRFGAALLDPLLNSLTAVFEGLFKIRNQLFGIADTAGAAFSRVAAIGREIGERVSAGASNKDKGNNQGQKALNNVTDAVQDVVVLVESAAQRAISAIVQAVNALKPSVLTVTDAFIRLGRVFLEIKVDTFEALARVVANLVVAATPLLAVLTNLFNLYSRFLDLPVVQEFSKLVATMDLLKRAGMDLVTNLILVGTTIVRTVIPAVGAAGSVLAVVVGGVGAVVLAIGKLTLTLATLTAALAGLPGIAAGVASALVGVSRNLNQSGGQSVQAGQQINTVAGGFKNLGETAKLAGLNIIKSLGWTVLVQFAITAVVNAFGEYQKALEDTARHERAVRALKDLSTTYKNVGRDADYATRAARDHAQMLADAEYSRAVERLEEIRKKLNEMRYESQLGIQSFGEFLGLFDIRKTFRAAIGQNYDAQDAAALLAEEAKLRAYNRDYEDKKNKENIQENIRLEAQNRVNLEREIKDLQRQHQDELFQQRQALAQKEVEIFQAAGELRIYQMEQANQKLIEGEEGASKVALEALNQYLSTRERGELEIEAAKRTVAIEVTNMEKTIADYRLSMEQKIFDLRKRAAENDVAAAQAAAEAGSGGATNGAGSINVSAEGFNTAQLSRATQAASKFNGIANMCAESVKAFYSSMGVSLPGVTAWADTVRNAGTVMRDWSKLKPGDLVATGRPGDTPHVGVYTGGNNVFHQSRNRGLKAGNYPDLGYFKSGYFVRPGNQTATSNTAAPARSSTTQPTLQGRTNIGDGKREAAEVASAIRSVGAAMERLRALQKALTDAKTKEALEAVAKSVFDPVELEGYQDKLLEVQLTYTAIAASAAGVFDPARAQIEIDALVKEGAARRELGQIENAINKSTLLSADEKKRILGEIVQRHAKYVESLKAEASAQKTIEAVQRGGQFLQQLRAETFDIQKDLEVVQLKNKLEYAGASPLLIALETEKLRIRQRIVAETKNLSLALSEAQANYAALEKAAAAATGEEKVALQAKLADALSMIKLLQQQIASITEDGKKREAAEDDKAKNTPGKIQTLIGQWRAELKDTEGMVVSLAQTIQSELASAMSNAISGVISGTTTVKEAFLQMFGNIGKAFVDMATQMIAKAMVLKVLGLFANAPASGALGGSGLGTGELLTATAGTSFSFAGGGYTGNAPRVGGIDGQGGFPAILHPQETVIDHSRAMQRFRPVSGGARAGGGVGGAALAGLGGGGDLQVSYNVTEINSMRFVTEDQFRSGLSQAARQGAEGGHARVMGDLRNSRSTRARLGMR